MIGVIGGSGLYEMEGLILKEVKKITTPYGEPSDFYRICEYSGRDIVFLPRHGSRHGIPPHRINYRANIWGFRELGTERIVSISATGGIGSKMKPGTIVIPDQIIDMTNGRKATFYEGEEGVVHIDFTEPYCPEMRDVLFRAGRRTSLKLKKSGTYICVNGPRLETKAEIFFYSRIGADVVGMTAMPEASLAREAQLCYAGLSIVTNYAAGIAGKKLAAIEVIEEMQKTAGKLKRLLQSAFTLVSPKRKCNCKESLREAKV
jgi:5'-methylthioadenosine phosphorylase